MQRVILAALLLCARGAPTGANRDDSCDILDPACVEPADIQAGVDPVSLLQISHQMDRSQPAHIAAPDAEGSPEVDREEVREQPKLEPFDFLAEVLPNESPAPRPQVARRTLAELGAEAGERMNASLKAKAEARLNASLKANASLDASLNASLNEYLGALTDGWYNEWSGLFPTTQHSLAAQMAGLASLIYNPCPPANGDADYFTWKTVAGWELAQGGYYGDELLCGNMRKYYHAGADADGHDNYAMFVHKKGIPSLDLPAGSCAIVIEGTSSAANWMNNVHFESIQWCDKTVHKGFLNELSQLIGGRGSPAGGEFASRPVDPLFTKFAEFRKSSCPGKIFTVGHSLGGVQAEMFAWCADHMNPSHAFDMGMYTFGAPGSHYNPRADRMVDDEGYGNDCFQGERFYNWLDPVPAAANYAASYYGGFGLGHAKVKATQLAGSYYSPLSLQASAIHTDKCYKDTVFVPAVPTPSIAAHSVDLYLSRLAGSVPIPDGILGEWMLSKTKYKDMYIKKGTKQFSVSVGGSGYVFVQGGTWQRGSSYVYVQSRLLPTSDTKYCITLAGQGSLDHEMCLTYYGFSGGYEWLDGTVLGTTFEAYKV